MELSADPAEQPSIEILYPEPGQQLELDSACLLTDPLVVNVEAIDLVPPEGDAVPGEGHWHGGPSLEQGYCSSSIAWCEGGPAGSETSLYDGSGRGAGLLTLQVSLRDGTHSPLGPVDEVEVEVIDPGDRCADADE